VVKGVALKVCKAFPHENIYNANPKNIILTGCHKSSAFLKIKSYLTADTLLPQQKDEAGGAKLRNILGREADVLAASGGLP